MKLNILIDFLPSRLKKYLEIIFETLVIIKIEKCKYLLLSYIKSERIYRDEKNNKII